MDRIVYAAIKQVAEHESRKEHKGIMTYKQVHDEENNGGNDQAGNRRHEEPFLVPGKMMVIPVQDINKLLRPLTLGHHMKGKPVHQVFKKSPEKRTPKKSQRDPPHGIIQVSSAVIQGIADDGYINSPDHQGMGFGQHFQVMILE